MNKKQAHNLMYFLRHQGYLDSNLTPEHSEYNFIIELITKNLLTDEFINGLILTK
jgi:hypothetical protein